MKSTYLQLPDAIKRKAKMAAAGLSVSLSDYVAALILADCAKLGVKDIGVVADSDEKEASDD